MPSVSVNSEFRAVTIQIFLFCRTTYLKLFKVIKIFWNVRLKIKQQNIISYILQCIYDSEACRDGYLYSTINHLLVHSFYNNKIKLHKCS